MGAGRPAAAPPLPPPPSDPGEEEEQQPAVEMVRGDSLEGEPIVPPAQAAGRSSELSRRPGAAAAAASQQQPQPQPSPPRPPPFGPKTPSDLHLWVEPGLADEELQRQRRQQKRREACSGLMHRPTLPCLVWLKLYSPKRDILWDVQAGLVVGIMVIPQGMAYAGLANLSPIFGLYCAIVPAFTYAAFGPSRESAIGAMALVSIMVGQAVADLTPDNAPLPARVAVAVKLAFLTGLLQMGMGLLKMGEVASLVSHPVMQGFSSGGEILIAVSQVKWIFGVRIPPQRYAWQTLYYLCAHIRETEPWTLLLGVVTCGLLFALSKWRRLTKARMEVQGGAATVTRTKRILLLLATFGPFAAMISTACIAYGMEQRGVGPAVIGKVPQGLHTFPSYDISGTDLQRLIQPAFLLALISFMLSFAVSKKYSEKNGTYEVDANQELFAIGLAHTLGSFCGAFPVAGSFSRTAVAVESNQRSQLSGVVTAALVLLAVSFLTSTFYWIPQCALAALVQAAIFSVMDFSSFAYAYRTSKTEFVVMLVTFLVTLGAGIDKGIAAGVLLSLFTLIRRTSHPRLKVMGVVRGRRVMFRDVTRYSTAQQIPGVCIVRIDESVNFASCASIKEQLHHIAQNPDYVRRRQHAARSRGGAAGQGGPGAASPAASPILVLMRNVTAASWPGGSGHNGLRSNQGSMMGPHAPAGEPERERARRPETMVLDFSGVNHVDLSGVKTLDELHAALARDGQAMYVCNVKSGVRDRLAKSPIWARLGGDLLFLSLPALLDHLVGRGQWGGGEEAAAAGDEHDGPRRGAGEGAGQQQQGEQQAGPTSLKDIVFDGYRYNDWVI